MLGRGLLIGAFGAVGALMLVPGVASATARAARPLMRSAMKHGAKAAVEIRAAAAEAFEHFEDLAAEVRAELKPETSDGESAGAEAGSEPAQTREDESDEERKGGERDDERVADAADENAADERA